MTVGNGGIVTESSEIRMKYLRVIRIVCHDAGEETECRTAVIIEERRIEDEPEKITESSLIRHNGVGCVGASTIIAYAENEEVNEAAQAIYSRLLGRTDETHILRIIGRLVSSSQALASATPIPL